MNCAWCSKKDEDDNSDSHGICAECEAKYFPPKEKPEEQEEQPKAA